MQGCPARQLRYLAGSVISASVLLGALLIAPASSAGLVLAASSQGASPACQGAPPAAALGAGGIHWAVSPACGSTSSGPSSVGGPATPPSTPYRNFPPLNYYGGSVAGLPGSPGELTVTPVYWVPARGKFTIPADYEKLINQFIADAAVDNGAVNNVFAALSQYTDANHTRIHPKIHAGAPITDTTSYPTSGCTPDHGVIWQDGTTYSTCITNNQLVSEAKTFTAAKGLPNQDLAHLYLYLLPEGVETCLGSTNGAGGGICSINANPGFCGYHSFIAPPLVANLNYAVVDSPTNHWTCSSDAGSNTGGNQTPNSDIAADTEISMASHEIAETITDPTGAAWLDSRGFEVGDECAYIYGDSSTFQGRPGHYYNQTIHNHHYFIQEEFSNDDYRATASHAYSCIAGEDWVKLSPRSAPPGTTESATGGGFASGESVVVRYQTRPATPVYVTICTATATPTGLFSCTGKIPSGTAAGPAGVHTIKAIGSSSHRIPTVAFVLGS